MKKITKQCPNCYSIMWWNEREQMWECKLCGYSEETRLRKGIPKYV